MPAKLVIFDLDGTLLDSLDDLAAAVNHAMESGGYPTHSREAVRSFVGTGIRNLIIKALPEEARADDAVVERSLETFVQYYRANIHKHTKPYDGIHDMLRQLDKSGIKIAVASNKFQEGTEMLVHHFFPDVNFCCILGNRKDMPLKPSPDVIRLCMEKAGISDSKDVTMVGDSPTDINTAINAGVSSIGVTWGFRSRQDLEQAGAGNIADTAVQVQKLLSPGHVPLFQRQPWVAIFALTAAVVWGWAYPLIKLGFEEFGISADMTASKMLFAGIRFTVSGLIILCIARSRGLSFKVSKPSAWWFILLFALFNTTLHYAFFYLGLSYSAGSRSAILNSLGTFVTVIMACLLFKNDRMNFSKALGCIVGIAGICILNVGGNSGEVSVLGDSMIILNALCGSAASLMTRGLGQRSNIFVGTGYGLAIGGALLMVPALAMGGTLPIVSLWGCVIMMLLVGISSIGFTLYNKLLSCNPVSKVAIYNSLIPVVGAITSCLCLSEPFYWKYCLSAALAAAGIYIINRAK